MLLVMSKSPLRRAIRSSLRARGAAIRLGKPSSTDLFERAMACETLVYAPASNLLRGKLEPTPDPKRMHAVLRAANAPGCSTVVVVVPSGGAYDAELDVLRKVGKPYVIVAAPPLVEEVGAELAEDDVRHLWIPSSGRMEATEAERVARAIVVASESQYQGRIEPVAGTTMELPALFQHASKSSQEELSVHAVWPPLHRAIRPVARWLIGGEPNGVRLAAALSQRACEQRP